MTAHPRLHPMVEEELEAELSSTMELSRDSRSLCALRALPARKFSRLRCFCCWETDTEAAIPIEDVGELVATIKAADLGRRFVLNRYLKAAVTCRRLCRGIRIQLSVCNM